MIPVKIIILILAATGYVSATTPPRITINQATGNSSLGVVPGVKTCGGHSTFVEWRLHGCKPEDNPCKLVASVSEKWTSEVDFIPNESIIQLVAKSRAAVDGGTPRTQYEIPIVSSSIYPHIKYTIHFDSPGVAFNGKSVKIQGLLYRIDPTMTSELCIEADFDLVQK